MIASPDRLDPIVTLALEVLAAALILAVGWALAAYLGRLASALVRRHPRIDVTLATLAGRILRALVVVVTVIAVLDRFGVQTTSLVALIGAAGLAVGLALQGALANVAAGVLVLVVRPYRVGDAVLMNGTAGVVEEIGLFITRLRTFEGVVVYMPNGTVWGGAVQNFSQAERRRVDITFGIGYDDDIDRAIGGIGAVLDAESRVLAEPAPMVAVEALGDSSVDILCRFWTLPADLFATRFEVTKRVKQRFDAEGITIPYPQRDVHLVAPEDARDEAGRPAA